VRAASESSRPLGRAMPIFPCPTAHGNLP
jgi:hypothetical protein